MGFYSKVIADSVNDYGQRLTTLEVCYPRFIHSEIMTHRDRARNSASSRAIPWPKMMERINAEPVIPIKWGMEKPGMQAGEELPRDLQMLASLLWEKHRRMSVEIADALHNIGATYNALSTDESHQLKDVLQMKIGGPGTPAYNDIKVHKSLPNRLTEAHMWITVVMTATEWKNLFRLRLHGDAEVHFQELMKHIGQSFMESKPKHESFGSWHTPYIHEDDGSELYAYWQDNRQKYEYYYQVVCAVSTARCARVSYLTQDGKRNVEKDVEPFYRLDQRSGFGHWSPHEHVAMSSTKDERSGPYRGWKQFRKLFENENADGP